MNLTYSPNVGRNIRYSVPFVVLTTSRILLPIKLPSSMVPLFVSILPPVFCRGFVRTGSAESRPFLVTVFDSLRITTSFSIEVSHTPLNCELFLPWTMLFVMYNRRGQGTCDPFTPNHLPAAHTADHLVNGEVISHFCESRKSLGAFQASYFA